MPIVSLIADQVYCYPIAVLYVDILLWCDIISKRKFGSYSSPHTMASVQRSYYSPPWGNASIIGVAGSSGSGKTSLALAIVASLNLPWVVILSMV